MSKYLITNDSSKILIKDDDLIHCKRFNTFQFHFSNNSPTLKTFESERIFIILKGVTSNQEKLKNKEFLSYLQNLSPSKLNQVVDVLDGNYTLIVYYKEINRCVMINTPVYMYPSYYYVNENLFYASSHLDIINTVIKGEPDKVSLLEFLYFNYPISNNTFIKNIKILPGSSLVDIHEKVSIQKYFDYGSIFQTNLLSKKKSVDLVHEILSQQINEYVSGNGITGVAQTSGWDSRLLLSFINDDLKDRYFLYSWGILGVKDYDIPLQMSKDLGYEYHGVSLDGDFRNAFKKYALEAIFNTSGYRTITRARYMYASEVLSPKSGYWLSGNCGSNIIKIANFPGTLNNLNVFKLFASDKLEDAAADLLKKEVIPFIYLDSTVKEEFIERINSSSIIKDNRLTKNQQFYAFVLSDIESKYFGMELHSYADKIANFSPFVSFKFIKAISQTPYFGGHYDLNSRNILHKYKAARLYSELIARNNKRLLNYTTGPGYAIGDMNHLPGLIRIAYNFIKTKLTVDPGIAANYDTKMVLDNLLKEDKLPHNSLIDIEIFKDLIKKELNMKSNYYLTNAYSYLLWAEEIHKNS